ncbi:radical SAM protein [Patescibacteria group bacterium]|nr:radical SAM protein [Patescibacteria group bacterium]
MPKIYRKTLLYKSGVEYADYSLNHVLGCSHGCRYPCYAMMMKKRCGIIRDYQEWIKPKVVANALELLDKEIPKYKHKIKFVHLCFSTDPFMFGQPEVEGLTLKILARLKKDDIRCVVLTKGVYPKDLLDKEKYGINNEYGITLVSLSEKFKSKFEPFSAPLLERIESLETLHKAGLKTWISMEPYPTPNLAEQNLNDLLTRVSFVDKIIFGKFNYNTHSSQFKNSKEFYDDCAGKVVAFCQEKGLECHIKFGTRTRRKCLEKKSKTQEIFSELKPSPFIYA